MPDLSSNSRSRLLEIARKAIACRLETGKPFEVQNESPELMEKRACFVTLYKENRLRGCVGTFEKTKPLAENIAKMAAAAAFHDPRFPNLDPSELKQLKIKISILGDLQKVRSMEEIQIGRDGIYVKLGERAGTFLPEVAVEQNWTLPEFVMYCCLEKAGLSHEECRAAEIYRYEVEKIEE